MSWLSSCNRWLRVQAARPPLQRRKRHFLALEQLEDRCVPAVTITEFSASLADGSSPYGIVTGPDGNLWFTEFAANKIARMTPDGSSVTEFADGLSPSSCPHGITVGPD